MLDFDLLSSFGDSTAGGAPAPDPLLADLFDAPFTASAAPFTASAVPFTAEGASFTAAPESFTPAGGGFGAGGGGSAAGTGVGGDVARWLEALPRIGYMLSTTLVLPSA